MDYTIPEVLKYVIRNKAGDVYFETEDGSHDSHEEATRVMLKINDQIPAISWKDSPRISDIYIQYIFADKDATVH